MKASKMINMFCMIIVISMAGCACQNAEQITYNDQGQKISQTRTGFCAWLYWFGVEKYQIKNNDFSATTTNAWGKSDPNSIRATGEAVGEVGGTVVKKVLE